MTNEQTGKGRLHQSIGAHFLGSYSSCDGHYIWLFYLPLPKERKHSDDEKLLGNLYALSAIQSMLYKFCNSSKYPHFIFK
jgi:hypothetical protein